MLNNSELLEIKGGISWTVATAVVSLIIFAIGAVDGYLRPLKCN